MATVNEKMTNLANAIREKTGTTEPLSLDQMAVEVMTIENNGEATEQPAYLDRTGLQRVWANAANKFASKGHLSVTSLDANGQTPAGQTPDTPSIPITSTIPADAEIWIDEDDESTEESHVYDKNNPHGVTAEQIGAPSIQVFSQVVDRLDKHADQHRSNDTLTWDGDVTGHETVVEFDTRPYGGVDINYYVHISDTVPTVNDLVGKASWTHIANWKDGTTDEIVFDISESDIMQYSNDTILLNEGYIYIAKKDNCEALAWQYGDTWLEETIILPKKGVYLVRKEPPPDDDSFMLIESYCSQLTTPNSNLSGGSDPITPDMIGAAPASHATQHSWSDTLTWDGDETGRTAVVMSRNIEKDILFQYVLVSDKVPTSADLAHGISYEDLYTENGETEVTKYFRTVEVDSEGYAYVSTFASGIEIIPYDKYVVYHKLFPKKGIYILKSHDGSKSIDGYIKSVTIPGFAFESGSDPIMPEMIKAAPKYHASDTGVYGVSDAENYGHMRLAELNGTYNGEYGLFNFDENNNLIDKDGNVVEDHAEYLKGCAAGAYFTHALYQIMALNFNDIDHRIGMMIDSISQLRKDVDALKKQ